MTPHDLILRVIENKGNTYPVPKLPAADPADFYDVYDAESLARVLLEMRREEILTTLREEAITKEFAYGLIDELSEIETQLQKG